MEQPAPQPGEGPTSYTKGKRKQTKRFLEKNDALELAISIAELQERKSLGKTEKHHQTQVRPPQEHHLSASRIKLKETKALLAGQRSRVKRDKAKLRKRRLQEGLTVDVNEAGSSSTGPKQTARKSVSFA